MIFFIERYFLQIRKFYPKKVLAKQKPKEGNFKK